MVRLAETLSSSPSTEDLMFLKQLGVTDVVAGPPVPPVDLPPYMYINGYARYVPSDELEAQVWELPPLLRLKRRIEDAGLRHSVIEISGPPMRIITGRSGRDEQIENWCKRVRNMGKAGIPILAIGFHLGNWRTPSTTPERGGAEVGGFDYEFVKDAPVSPLGVFTEEQLWDSLEYFLKRVMPVHEEAKVRLAVHPDDPPTSPIAGGARILRSPEAFRRMLEIVPSDYLGLEFCQGCFAEMGVDVVEAIRYFGSRKKIFYVHFRDVRGAVPKFQETFHDNGKTDMLAAMRAYKEAGFDGPLRPDHYPRMVDDPHGRVTRAFAIGYIKGLMEAVHGKPVSETGAET